MRRENGTRGKRSGARSGMLLRVALGVVAVTCVTTLPWPAADAQDATVTVQKSRARREQGRHRKLEAVERLCRVDTSAARTAIKELADDADDRTALTAIGALCREDFSGARAKLKSIFEDDERSDFVRSAAIAALLDLREGDGDSWRDVRGYVRTHTAAGDAVREMAIATATRLWRSEVSDE